MRWEFNYLSQPMNVSKLNKSTRKYPNGRAVKGGLRSRQIIGKYKIGKLLANGGFGRVYSATDTIEGIQVALKIPFDEYVDDEMLDLFRQEVRLVAQLDHPGILPVKNADFIDDRFVIVTRLGLETLESRMTRRMSVLKVLDYIEQMIGAVSCAHDSNILHCDIKPENFILFEGDVIRLTDFGIAKVSKMTIAGSGTGTVGHMAPEQAMGRPNKRSDVFSLGLIMYRMLAGQWPEYPFDWPPPGAINLRRKRIHPDLINLIRKAISARPKDRFVDVVQMEELYEEVYETAVRNLKRRPRR
ncbi:MAG: serine/threonine protein kinase [Mariniblastus sp.]|jgi:serine/threonine protein kinase